MRQADGEKGRTLTRGDLSDKPKKKRQPASEDTAESTEVSRGRSTEKKTGRTEHTNKDTTMVRLNSERRRQKTSQEAYPQREVVNTPGHEMGQSSRPTQTRGRIHEERHSNLLEQILEKENLKKALRRVELNKGAPGIDGVTVENLKPHIRKNWVRIREELFNGSYKPAPVRRVEIPKPGGGVRLLGIPTVIDRLIQQAILQILTPIYDPTFSSSSYGFRPGRSAHQAVKQAQRYIMQGCEYVVDIDLEKFFDRVNHDIVMSKLTKRIADKRILRLIRAYLQAGVMLNGCCITTEEGTPQGGPLSPLLSNIVLDELDVELEKRGHRFIRYADDCNIYVKSERAGLRVMTSVTQFVERKLKLKVNREKSAVDRPWKRKVLGFSFTRQKEARIRLAYKTKGQFKENIRKITRRTWGVSMQERIKKLNSYLKGWMGYFSLAQTPSVIAELDEWIRRRLRTCLLKQWKNPETKQRNLVALGIPAAWAIKISWSRKKCWRLSNTPQINKALGLAYWQEQGLESLVVRYGALRSTV